VSVVSASSTNGAVLIVAHPMQDVVLPSLTRIEVPVPADVFASTTPGATVALSALQVSGAALPSWLSFDSVNGKFVGTPPKDFDGTLNVKVVAADSSATAPR
jgi:hypothetical protein